MTFNRVSHFSIYEQCTDKGLPANLCICNKHETSAKHRNATIHDIVGKESIIHKLKPCLFLIKRPYSENSGEEDYVGVEVYELANICDDKMFSVRLGAEADNVRASTELPIIVKLPPRTIFFASVMMTEVGFVDTKLKLKLRVVSEDVQWEVGRNDREKSGKEKGNKKGKLSEKWQKIKSRTTKKADEKWKETGDR